MAYTENPACGTKALPFLIGIVERFWIDSSAFLLAIQHPATAAVLAFVSLGATLVLAVFHDVFALATVAEPIFYYHLIRFLGQIYISVNLCHYQERYQLLSQDTLLQITRIYDMSRPIPLSQLGYEYTEVSKKFKIDYTNFKLIPLE